MQLRNTEQAYGTVARGAHWLTALLLTGSFTLGYTMTGLAVSPQRLRLYSYHKWIGVTVFLLVILRLAWRFRSRPPALPAQMPAWERSAAEISHRLLYLLLFATPLSGWLMSSAKGFQTVYFGVLPIPNLLDKNPPLGEILGQVHYSLQLLLLLAAGLHIAAAFKHHYRDRDDVLARMAPGVSPLPPRNP